VPNAMVGNLFARRVTFHLPLFPHYPIFLTVSPRRCHNILRAMKELRFGSLNAIIVMQYLIRTYFPLTIGYLKTYNSNNYFSDFTIAVIIDSHSIS